MKLPVFPNWYPYNNMIFDGRLQVGDCAVKTRSYSWNYRGSVLFYTSGRTARRIAEVYGYKDSWDKHKVIIGVGDLVDVRELTLEEAKQMVCNFNNLSRRNLNRVLCRNEIPTNDPDAPFWFYSYGYYVAPLRIGYFFKNLRRLSNPVPFNCPAGPVKPIFTDVRKDSRLYEELAPLGPNPGLFIRH